MPTMKFTARGIQAIKTPEKGRVDYIDEGLVFRVSDSNHRSWGVFYRFNHRFRRMTLGTYPHLSLKEAREMADEVLHAASNRKDPTDLGENKKAERKSGTFGSLIERFLADRSENKSIKEYRRILEKYFTDWHRLKAHTITSKDVIEKMDEEKKRGNAHAHKCFAVLHSLFNFGVRKQIIPLNPSYGLERPGKVTQRDRVLSAEEIRKVWKSILVEPSYIQAQFKLRFYTAQRGGEVLTVEWSEIDFEGAMWNIPASKSKNGHAHRVPLTTQALEVFNSLKSNASDSPWVFPSRVGDVGPLTHVQKAIQRVRKRAGVSFTGHDIRRTVASHMASLGVPRFTIRRVLNHRDNEITSIYDRYSYDAEKRKALQLWADFLDNTINQTSIKKLIPLVRVRQSKMMVYNESR